MSPLPRLVIACFVLLAVGPSVIAQEPPRPNVLLICVDDLRPTLGCYGDTVVKSPHIDRLAQRGVAFQRAYVQQAVCSPSRTCLLTGMRPDTTRVYNLTTHFRTTVPEVVTLPQHFKQNGYAAIGIGKIYHGGLDDADSWSRPHQPGKAPVWVQPENLRRIAKKRKEARARGLRGAKVQRASRGSPTEAGEVPDTGYRDGVIAARALRVLGEMAESRKPFFLAVGFVRPHLPFCAPKPYFDLYAKTDFTLPATWMQRPAGAPPFALTTWGELRSYDGIPARGPVTEDQALDLIRAYHACVSYVDAQVGKLLDALDRLGLAKNTLVVLWGDHGWKLGDYGCWCKHTNVELDTRIPVIVSAPKTKARGAATQALIETVDIYPALCDLAGLPKPAHLEGTSFRPLLDDPDRAWKRAAISQYPRSTRIEGKRVPLMGYSLRTDRWRFTRWQHRDDPSKTVALELYDHTSDPGEMNNLASRPEHAATVEKLTTWLAEGWRAARPQ